jgi:type I restriction enzyme S subunit
MSNSLRLGDLVTIERGSTYKSAMVGRPGPVLLGLAAIERNGGFRSGSLRTYGGDSPDRMLVRPGQLYASLKDLTQAADLLGSVARLPAHSPVGRLTQDTVRIDLVSDVVTADYVYWCLRTPQYRAYCRAHATGTTNLGLPREDFLDFEIPKPTPWRLALVDAIGALDDLIDINRALAHRAQSLATTLASSSTARILLTDLASVADVRQFRPDGPVDHFSIPSFDEGQLPVRVNGESIKSGKLLLEEPVVLVSRLNPQTPRVWMAYPSDVPAAASTEFVPLVGAGPVAVEEVWAVCVAGEFAAQMMTRVTGTTGSHQRVDKAAIPQLLVADVRKLDGRQRIAIISLVREASASLVSGSETAHVRDELLPLLLSGQVRVEDAAA